MQRYEDEGRNYDDATNTQTRFFTVNAILSVISETVNRTRPVPSIMAAKELICVVLGSVSF